MNPAPTPKPEQLLADFFTAYTAAAVDPDNDPAEVIDRFHTRDIVQVADGVRLDHDRLVAHLRPVRKNLRHYRFEVHEAVADGARFAARMTIHAQLRKADLVTTEVFMFGEFAPDGRLRRAEQLTRTVPAA
ncbi:nuclear transport factor 2 family protein [Nocardia brasiliensis]|uniref:nuclear transport factor 2 family protein n=1 Tax=Nocardia brasiliensis TaxID=37326 RepID=UPI002458D91C|nr:nuclear transport factor 2 family protein [Nocardia brasiliensis]